MTDLVLATADAAREYAAARANLRRAVLFDRDRGVGHNEIARMAAGVISRPVVLRFLAVEKLAVEIRAVLREHHLDSYVEVGTGGGHGGWASHVHVHNATDFAEFPQLRATLWASLLTALASIALHLGDATEEGFLDTDEQIMVRQC